MKKTIHSFVLVCSFLFTADTAIAQENKATAAGKNPELQFPAAAQFANSKLTSKIIPAANETWCYDILADGRTMIHQPSVPGLPGNEGFKTRAAAQKVADLVIQKIKNGEMPPSITKAAMQQIGAL